MSRLRVAVIGTGGIAAAHADAINGEADRVELVGAVDVDLARVESFARQYHIPHFFTDLDALLHETRPDLVHLCTPPALHVVQALRCLDAGAHVWCEKPLCGSLADFDRISDAETRTGKWVTTVFQWRSGSMGKHIKRLIDGGAFGRALVGVCNTLWYRTAAYYQVDWRGRWDNELGGTTLGHGVHLMDFFLWLFGEWRDVRAVAATLDHDIEIDDASAAVVRFENGALGTITNSTVSPRQESYLRMDFQRATLEVSGLYHYTNANWRFSTYDNSPYAESSQHWAISRGSTPSGHAAAYRDLLDDLMQGRRPALSGAEARKALEFVTALYKSSFTGQIITRGSITPDDPFYHALNGVVLQRDRE